MRRRRKHHNRRRGGIGLSAAVTLCLAASLLLFARAGGEQMVQDLISRLAGNGDFIARAVALELGLSPETAEVYAPRTAAAARSEDADDPLAESTYIPLEEENDAPVLDAADKAATITVNNETSYDVDVAACLASGTAIRADGDGPQVLIVHTHGSESYTPDAAFPYSPSENTRTTDTLYNVVRVGDELQKVLGDNGVQAVHIHDIFRDGEAQTGSARIQGTGLLHPVKFIKDQRQLLGGNHVSVIDHRHGNDLSIRKDLHQNLLSLSPVFDRVSNEIIKEPGQQISVGRDRQRRHVARQLIGQMMVGKAGVKLLQKLAQKLHDIHLSHIHGNFAAAHLGKAEQLLDQLFQTLRLCVGDVNIFLLDLRRLRPALG